VRCFIAGPVLALLGGCADTGRDEVRVPIFLAGTDVSQPFPAIGGVEITLERADLAFGPLYLCAGYQAGALCETARLEWIDAAVVNATDAAPRLAGDLTGASGRVLSYMYDLGLPSLLTSDSPLVMPAAEDLGGVSLRIEGIADVAGMRVPFAAGVPIQQELETELGVPVVRKSENENFEHDVKPGERGLLVRFDPRAWIRGVDFRDLSQASTCSLESTPRVCAGSVEETCGDDGEVVERRDCADSGEVCLAGLGCRLRLEVEADTQAFRAIRNALVVEERPTFDWTPP
jgi:hypothetical protein